MILRFPLNLLDSLFHPLSLFRSTLFTLGANAIEVINKLLEFSPFILDGSEIGLKSILVTLS